MLRAAVSLCPCCALFMKLTTLRCYIVTLLHCPTLPIVSPRRLLPPQPIHTTHPAAAAGIIAIDLARQMLQLMPNTYVLVVSTENITQNWCALNSLPVVRSGLFPLLLPVCVWGGGHNPSRI